MFLSKYLNSLFLYSDSYTASNHFCYPTANHFNKPKNRH